MPKSKKNDIERKNRFQSVNTDKKTKNETKAFRQGRIKKKLDEENMLEEIENEQKGERI